MSTSGPQRLLCRQQPDVYQSDLRTRLPPGLALPRTHAVRDIDDQSAAIWMELVPARAVAWDLRRHARAAYLLGRLAASPAVLPLAAAVHPARAPRSYADLWLNHKVLPELHSDDLWRRPLVSQAFDSQLRHTLLAAADTLPDLLDELDSMPVTAAHGDASTHNLLVTETSDGFTLIDFGFWGCAPAGFDLAQLILGEIQLGTRSAGQLPQLEETCLAAYVHGMHVEGADVSLPLVRRSHALLMTVFHALPAIPYEHRSAPWSPQLHHIFAHRAATARFILDLLAATRSEVG